MREVVITDVRYRMAMTAIWSLGKKGIDITAVEFEDTHEKERLGFYSKYVKHCRIVPNPKGDENLFINALLVIGKDIYSRSGEKPILIIAGSATHEIVTRHMDQFKGYFDFNLVEPILLNRANNTFSLSKVAIENEIPFPDTTWLQDDETIYALAGRIKYPVVIKYRAGEKLTLKPNQRYAIIHKREDFINQYKLMHDIQEKPLVQEYISGAGYGVSVVFDAQSRPVEIFCHKRIREYPVTGGPSTFCTSVWDDRLVAYAVKLLKALNWRGFAMVEFKGDINGDIRLMEINPRFWGSMPLSLLSGCDMPLGYYKSVMGLTTPHLDNTRFSNRYKIDTKMRYLLQDLLSLKGYLRLKKHKLGFLLGFMKDLINPFVRDGLFRLNDPMPGFMYVRNALLRRKNTNG